MQPALLIHTHTRRVALFLCLCMALVVGCAPTTVTPVPLPYSAPAMMPTGAGNEPIAPLAKPDRVLVYDFAVSADDVALDRAVGAQLLQHLQETSQTEEQLKVGRAVAQALSVELVKAIQQLGLPAERASEAPLVTDNTLAIEGQFVAIDEGNRLRRMVIGLGAGATEVKTQVQVYRVTSVSRKLIQEFETSAQSPRKPGMAETMGVGAAARGAQAVVMGAGVGIASEYADTVEADARRTAKAVAEKLSQFFVNEGWISASTVD
jgi:hypothetical protein